MAHPTVFSASLCPQLASDDWPASYRGVGVKVEPLSDGTFCGVADGGFLSVPCNTPGEALSIATDWIAAHATPQVHPY